MILRSQLYGRARDLVCIITSNNNHSETADLHIVNALLKRNFLSVLSAVYANFNPLVSCRCETSESFGNYKTIFASNVSNFNVYGKSLHLPEPITAFMPMAGATITDNHRVSISAAATKNVVIGMVEDLVEDEARLFDASLVNHVKYETFATFLRRYEQ